ncbi:hypothetical protein ACQPZQ_15025 [Pseudonocardia sp. CA-142604]|uniref:hypothetical protein n=1 Tax=Pseudonocardia sp. CA-142604 TaxID=3240024 RepID=UPI003D8F220A
MVVSDVAAVVAPALTEGDPPDIQVITGLEALDYADVAARVSAVFARQVDYADIPAVEARSMMLDDGVLPWQAEGVLEFFEWVSCGGCDTVTDTVRTTAGEDARTLEHWLKEQRGAFIGRWPGGFALRF